MNAVKPMRLAVVVLGALAVVACGEKPQSPAGQAKPSLVTVAVGGGEAAGSRGWDGVVEAVRQAALSAQTTGRISAMMVDVNDAVAEGAVLLRLTGVEQQAGVDTARAQLKSAEAVLAEAESRFNRSTELVGRQLVSRADHDLARAARDSASAARDASAAQLRQAEQQAAYTVVRAPFAGLIATRDVEPGEAVAPGQRLLSLYAPGALRIEVQVPQGDAAAIRAAGTAQVQLADGRRLAARAVTVYPSADPLTHTVTVRVQLPVLDRAPAPGMTATVLFAVPAVSGAVRIPAATLVQRGEVSAVYVVTDAGVSLRQLRLGERIGEQIQVLAGLQGDERLAMDPVAATQWLVTQQQGGAVHE